MKPQEQGTLDRLCGVYAVINSLSAMCKSAVGPHERERLFLALVDVLNRETKASLVLVEGMQFRLLGKLIDAASDFAKEQLGSSFEIRRKVAFRSDVDLALYWKAISEHVEVHGQGSAILGMSGQRDHWTCVGRVSEKRIDLIDSDRLKFVRRSRATTGEPTASRPYCFWPTQTYMLQRIPS